MATKQSIAIREYAAREAIQAAIRDISDALGVSVTPQPLEPVRDPAYRAMRELEQLADLLGQIRDVLQPPEGAEESVPAESGLEENAGDPTPPELAEGVDDSADNSTDESLADSLEALTVQQLRDLAEGRGITVDAKARKAEIVDALLAAYEDSQA